MIVTNTNYMRCMAVVFLYLQIGLTDESGVECVKVFCAKCQDVYSCDVTRMLITI